MSGKQDEDRPNPSATTPVTRPSGDRNATNPVLGDQVKPDEVRRRKDDLERQAEGTGVDLPPKSVA